MAELVNKINGPWFSKFDEDLATAFSIYCGISIAHVSGDRRAGAGPSALLSTLAVLALSGGAHPRLGLRALLLGCFATFNAYWSLLACFPSEIVLFPVLSRWPPRTMANPSYRYLPTLCSLTSGSSLNPTPWSASLWEMLGVLVQLWQLWPGTPTQRSLTLSLLLVFLRCGPRGSLQRGCRVPEQV